MPAKLTTEQFITKAKLIHGDKYDYSETEYFGNNKKVKVICPIHGPFTPLANDHLSKKAGCPSCAGVKKLTQEEFVARSKALWGDKYDYSEAVYKGFEKKVILTCDQGHRFEQLASSHLNGFNCPYCSGLARKTNEEFIRDARAKFGDKFDYSKVEYVNSTTPVTIVCPIRGEFQQKPVTHLSSATGYTSEIYNEPATYEEFVAKSRSVHGDRYDYSKSVYLCNKKEVEIVCKEHGPFWQLVHNHYRGAGCPECACGITDSKPELFVFETFSQFNPTKTKSILDGNRELDIYFPNHNLAVEVNGIYWHSDIKDKHKTSHKRKFEDCLKQGIKLMQFTDKEVIKKQEIVLSMVSNALGQSNRISARLCAVREVSFQEYSEFFTKNHISGSVSAKCAYGLFRGDQLVSCMSFGRPRFSNEAEWEILRFASKLNHSVVGGASRLFKVFVQKQQPQSVITYADLRFGNGEVYKQLGFAFAKQTDAGYSYHHGNGTVVSRYQAQKHKLPELLGDKFDPDLSERDNMVNNGYHRIYDCGNYVYLWYRP